MDALLALDNRREWERRLEEEQGEVYICFLEDTSGIGWGSETTVKTELVDRVLFEELPNQRKG